jgi:hypothetical protein
LLLAIPLNIFTSHALPRKYCQFSQKCLFGVKLDFFRHKKSENWLSKTPLEARGTNLFLFHVAEESIKNMLN